MIPLADLPPEIRAHITRERRARREAVEGFISGLAAADLAKAAEHMEALDVTGSWPAAMKRVARLGPLDADVRARMLEVWTRCGDAIRDAANGDAALLDALRVLLPPYTGPSVTLYRGDSAWNRRCRSYGLSWSASIDVARSFALGMWRTFQGGSVLVQVEAPAAAILCAAAEHGPDHFREEEYLVDRRRLDRVQVLERYAQRTPQEDR